MRPAGQTPPWYDRLATLQEGGGFALTSTNLSRKRREPAIMLRKDVTQ
jgi:hypothetical protein